MSDLQECQYQLEKLLNMLNDDEKLCQNALGGELYNSYHNLVLDEVEEIYVIKRKLKRLIEYFG